MRFLVKPREYRHPYFWVRVRVACGIFNLGLGVLLLASGPWTGPFAWLGALPLAGAALIFWTAYRLPPTACRPVSRVSLAAVEKHIANIFSKLGLAPSNTDHRRVLAVLRYLEY